MDTVQFIGGEPTLHPELPRLVRYALGKGLKVDVYTNLVHITPDLWKVFSLPGVSLGTSWSRQISTGTRTSPEAGIPGDDGILIDFREIKAGLREAMAPLRHRTMMPRHAPEVQITSENNTVSIVAGRKRYILPAEDVVVLPLVNTTTEAIADYVLERVLPYLHGYGLTTVELEVSEAPGTSATASFDFT